MIDRLTIYKTPGDGQYTNFVARAQNNGWVVSCVSATEIANRLLPVYRPKTKRKVAFIVEDIEFLSAEQNLAVFRAIDCASFPGDETVMFRIQNQDDCPAPEGEDGGV